MSLFEEAIQKTKRFLMRRRTVYRQVFGSVAGEQVLEDLARFCRATDTTFHETERLSNVLVGRREVFLRIQQHLNLTDDQLWKLYGRPDLDN